MHQHLLELLAGIAARRVVDDQGLALLAQAQSAEFLHACLGGLERTVGGGVIAVHALEHGLVQKSQQPVALRMPLPFQGLQRRAETLRRHVAFDDGKGIAVTGAAGKQQRQSCQRENELGAPGAHGGARRISNGGCRA